MTPRPSCPPSPRYGHRRLFVLILALHLLTIACVPALMASGLAARPSSTQAGNLGLLRVADGSVCAKALVRAYSKLGSRYVLGAKGPDVFDCSGYTRDAYAAANVQLGWTSYEQITQGQRTNCTYADFHGSTTTCWKPGDLLFLQYPAAGDPGGIGQHVAIYDHDGYIVGCENESVGCIRQLPERNHFYRDHFAMGRRIADCPIVSPTSVPAVAAR